LADLARAAALLRAQAGLPGLRNQQAVPVGGQGVIRKEPTTDNQHPTSNSPDERATSFDVGRSMLNVGCSSWHWLDSGPGDPAFNMALDEALLEAMPRLLKPVLRFYGWTGPAASFGYFQKYSEVERATRLRPLVRRPTGGGIVPHDADWTYSLAFPAGHEWFALKAITSYRRIHEWIQSAFARLNTATELAPASRKTRRSQCFAGYEQFDLLWREKKIAGAAQRRTRTGLLIQGSVQPPPPSLSRAGWQQAMRAVASVQGVEWVEFGRDAALLDRAFDLAAKKYSQENYSRKR
jgi:lipoate-protein ligase A